MSSVKYNSMWLLALVALITSVSYMHERYIEREAFTDLAMQHQVNLREIKSDITSRLNDSVNAIYFLYSTPPISGLVRAAEDPERIDRHDNTSFDGWRNRLETIFVAFLKNNEQYSQARLIYADSGEEFIRVDRVRGEVRPVSTHMLQNKSARNYITKASDLKREQLYISNVNLNREHEEISLPYQPTVRFILPVYSEQGKLFAFLVLNKNLNVLFSSAEEFIVPGQRLVYSDADGFFLNHFNQSLYFTKDLAPEKTYNAVYTDSVLLPNKLSLVTNKADPSEQFYVSSESIMVPSGHEAYPLTISIFSDNAWLSSFLWDRRLTFYSGTGLILLIFLLALMILNRSASKNRKLAEARAEAQAVVTGASDAILTLDSNGAITSCNFAAEKMFGTDKGQLVGETLHDYFNPFTETPIEVILNNEDTDIDIVWRKQQEDIHYHCSKCVIKQTKGVSALALFFRDITQDIRAKEEAANINQILESKIAQRTQELELARNEAVESSKVKSQFISNISHEMRTPLNGILGALTMLQRQKLQPETSKFINMAAISASNLTTLINDILDLSKIEAGKLDLESKSFNPESLVNSQIIPHAMKAAEKGLEFYLDTSAMRFREFNSDPHRIAQILNNIIGNAIKFTESGSVTVTVTSKTTNHNGLFSISVTDTGIGIEKSKIPRLFNAFQQASSQISTRYGGTGLGLMICKQLVNLLGGNIALSSAQHKGTTVDITLPSSDWAEFDSAELTLFRGAVFGIFASSTLSASIIAKTVQSLEGTSRILSIDEIPTTADNLPANIIIDLPLTQAEELCHQLLALKASVQLFVLRQFTQPADMQSESINYLTKPLMRNELIAKVLKVPELQTGVGYDDGYHSRADDIKLQDENLRILATKTLLIVDDNDINLEVAASLLSGLPINVITASSGEDAIALLSSFKHSGKAVHAILMDCNMPGISGYQTTELIRQGNAGEKVATIPIIAMTANALKGEKDKCLSVGMNDFITKPLDPNEFVKLTVAWLLKYDNSCMYPPSITESHSTKSESDTSQTAPESSSLWNKEEALSRLMNNEALLNKLVSLFLANADTLFNELSEAIQHRDFETIRQRSHKLKGQTAELGAEQFCTTLKTLEELAKSANPDVIELLNTAQQHFNDLVLHLRAQHPIGH